MRYPLHSFSYQSVELHSTPMAIDLGSQDNWSQQPDQVTG